MKGLKVNIKLATQVPNENSQTLLGELNKKAKLECSQICENIYLSGYNISQDKEFIKINQITHILNCANNSRNFKTEIIEGIQYLLLDLKDDPSFDIIYAIYSSVEFIENAVKTGGRVLIHCAEGVSRGPALLSSYFMWKGNLTREEAITKIKEKRECIDINLGFMVQLAKWGECLQSDKSCNNYPTDCNSLYIDTFC